MQIVTIAPADGALTVACPQCGLEYSLETLKQGGDSRMSTVRCACGEAFLAVTDARKSVRMNVAIRGMYTVMSDQGLGGLVTLRDISEGGVGFTLAAPCKLRQGWLITLVFELVGRERRVIVAKAIIRSVHDNDVGCSFLNPEQVRQDILSYFEHQIEPN